MMLGAVIADGLKNKELADLVRRGQELTNGGYELYDQNEAAIMKLLREILRLSKQEKEWYLYFDALYEIMYEAAVRSGDFPTAIKYAEVYYKDCDLYMDKELPRYSQTNMAYLNTWIYEYIFEAYFRYYQINDAKMDAFMKKFEEAALKYGPTALYYKCEIRLGILYRDADMLEHGKKNFEKYERELVGCYVCEHRPLFGYYLCNDQIRLAEEFMETIIHRRIPKQRQWCYKYCESAETAALYRYLLQASLTLCRPDEFRYFYEKYWMQLPEKTRRNNMNDTEFQAAIFLGAIAGEFEYLEEDLQRVQRDISESVKYTTVECIEVSLAWWCYFALLDKSGVHEVTVGLPGLPQKENGKTDCPDVSAYFEKRADDYGMKFAQARAKYDYRLVKNTYRECAGLSGKADQ